MDVAAKVTSKGQITIPKAVRDALGIAEGDRVVFRIDDKRAVLARVPDLLDLAGAVDLAVSQRGIGWEKIRRQTREARMAGGVESQASAG
ncbi:MAG: AbrB/MazE/SpoVT family DNA-binding domain-containing protein [bacterium]|nr:AbrB/MazE/SpoVT family DNA-binding domain-containing protein [bacterium]